MPVAKKGEGLLIAFMYYGRCNARFERTLLPSAPVPASVNSGRTHRRAKTCLPVLTCSYTMHTLARPEAPNFSTHKKMKRDSNSGMNAFRSRAGFSFLFFFQSPFFQREVIITIPKMKSLVSAPDVHVFRSRESVQTIFRSTSLMCIINFFFYQNIT